MNKQKGALACLTLKMKDEFVLLENLRYRSIKPNFLGLNSLEYQEKKIFKRCLKIAVHQTQIAYVLESFT